MQIYDVRDFHATDDGLILIGGFVGELIVSFTCMLEYIMASPQNASFKFTPESIEQFLRTLLLSDGNPFPEKVCKLRVVRELIDLNGGVEPAPEHAVTLLTEPKNVADFGLKFLLEW